MPALARLGVEQAVLVEFAPGKHLIGIDVVLARDQRNGCAGNQRLFEDSALEVDRMMAVAAALCRARRGLNDCVHDEICGHKLVVPSVSIMDKLGGLEQTVLAHRLRNMSFCATLSFLFLYSPKYT